MSPQIVLAMGFPYQWNRVYERVKCAFVIRRNAADDIVSPGVVRECPCGLASRGLCTAGPELLQPGIGALATPRSSGVAAVGGCGMGHAVTAGGGSSTAAVTVQHLQMLVVVVSGTVTLVVVVSGTVALVDVVSMLGTVADQHSSAVL